MNMERRRGTSRIVAQEGEVSEGCENCKHCRGNTNRWCSLLLHHLHNGDQYAGPKDARLSAVGHWAALEGEEGWVLALQTNQ
jgi:hypothetical protein